MLNRIFGLETEYGLLVNQDQPDHSPTWFAHKIRDHLFHVQRRGVLDLHHRGHDEPPGNGGFLTNAGRMYLDMGHLEWASPECESLSDVVAADRAGDQLLQDAIQDLGLADTVSLIKNNVDHETDATFGSHENYLVSRRFPFTQAWPRTLCDLPRHQTDLYGGRTYRRGRSSGRLDSDGPAPCAARSEPSVRDRSLSSRFRSLSAQITS